MSTDDHGRGRPRKRRHRDGLERILRDAHHGAKQPDGNLTDPNAVSPGDYVSCTMFYRVVGRTPGETKVMTADQRGTCSVLGDAVLANEFYTCKASVEKKVCRSVIAAILRSAKDAVVQVTFRRKCEAKSQEALIREIADGEHPTSTKRQRLELVQKLTQGPERVLTGQVLGTDEVNAGRTTMVDLTIDPLTNRVRLVDHRSIISVVYKNVRYVNTSK